MTTTVFLCFGNADECWNCGGWVHADGCVPEGERPIADHYCSEDCHDEALSFMERQPKPGADWCSTCGYDNYEHDANCQHDPSHQQQASNHP